MIFFTALLLVFLKIKKIKYVFLLSIPSFTFGWVIGSWNNGYLWGKSFFDSLPTKGGSVDLGTPMFYQFEVFRFLKFYPWGYSILLCSIVSFVIFIFFRKKLSNYEYFGFLFLCLFFTISFFSLANIVLIHGGRDIIHSESYKYGLFIRSASSLASFQVLFLLLIEHTFNKIKIFLLYFTILFFSILSISYYFNELLIPSKQGKEAQAIVDEFLISKKGTIICDRDNLISECSIVYSRTYQRYRPSRNIDSIYIFSEKVKKIKNYKNYLLNKKVEFNVLSHFDKVEIKNSSNIISKIECENQELNFFPFLAVRSSKDLPKEMLIFDGFAINLFLYKITCENVMYFSDFKS